MNKLKTVVAAGILAAGLSGCATLKDARIGKAVRHLVEAGVSAGVDCEKTCEDVKAAVLKEIGK